MCRDGSDPFLWTVCLVLDGFGQLGRAYAETDIEQIDLESVIFDLMSGQYNNPDRVIAFNSAGLRHHHVGASIQRSIGVGIAIPDAVHGDMIDACQEEMPADQYQGVVSPKPAFSVRIRCQYGFRAARLSGTSF